MSRYIATAAHRGATQLVNEFDEMLQSALTEYGPDQPVQFTNTAYHLPVIRAMLAHEVETLGDLKPVLAHARKLLHPIPTNSRWTP